MSHKIRGLTHNQVDVTLRHEGVNVDMPVHIYTRPETNEVNCLWLHGLGVGSLAVKNTVQAQHEASLRGASVRFPYARVPAPLVEEFTAGVLPRVLEMLQPRGKVAVGGESCGAGAAILGGAQVPERLSRMGLMEPAFMNNGERGDRPVLEFLWSLAVTNTLRQERPFHPGARQVAQGIVSDMAGVTLRGGPRALYTALHTAAADTEVSGRMFESLKTLQTAGVHVNIYGGLKDGPYPYRELISAADAHGFDHPILPIDAAHVTPGSPEGMVHVQRVLRGLVIPATGQRPV